MVLVLVFFFLISLQATNTTILDYTDVLNVGDNIINNSVWDEYTDDRKNSKINANFVDHAPISINGNKGFETCSCISQGNGTAINPYIIKDFFINGYPGNGISISNTDAHFRNPHSTLHTLQFKMFG